MKGSGVILVTRFNGTQFYINAELIQVVEATPDTIISLTTGAKVVVKDDANDVITKIIEYKQMIHSKPNIKQPRKRRGE
jgi:flagellar protein FlbD